jgi:hypothetical protein
MNPNEQNKAIAEYCGWHDFEESGFLIPNPPYNAYPPKSAIIGRKIQIPNYHLDLNEMHEAEKNLGDAVEAYAFNLLKLCAGYSDKAPIVEADCETVFTCAHATSQQRAEAFLRTIGKWKE